MCVCESIESIIKYDERGMMIFRTILVLRKLHREKKRDNIDEYLSFDLT